MGIPERKARLRQRREAEILEAALALSTGDDWQAVTIEAIARKAEVGKGTVYTHFASKDDVYARLALDFHQLVLSRLQALPGAPSARVRLAQVVRAFWGVYASHPEYQRVVEYCQRPDFMRLVSEELRVATAEVEAGFGAIIQSVVRQGVAEGLLPDRPVPLLLFGAQSALVGALKLLWLGVVPEEQEPFLAELVDFILAGLSRETTR